MYMNNWMQQCARVAIMQQQGGQQPMPLQGSQMGAPSANMSMMLPQQTSM